ncbi:MAG TPA: MFS transporter [Dehalococcoidia bacterium]|nr:MFS transporter [Dehalococcoidia bacterium]
MGEGAPAGRFDPVARGRRLIDGTYLRADGIIDRGQRQAFRFLWFFLPETSIAKDARFQQVLASRFFSDAGQQAVMYGALIAVVRGGGSAFEAALVGVAALVPPALLGLYGGAVADALPKRVALAAIYNLQAALCVIVPLFFGTGLPEVLFLVFAVNALGQVSGPTESSVLPLIASDAQLATAASLVSLMSSVGTAAGTAVLAPVLVRAFGVAPVLYGSAVLLALAASRVFDLATHGEPRARTDWRRPSINARATIEWLFRRPAVGTMIFVAALAGTASVVVQTLAPRYVQSVLHVDPADSVYVFAPTAVGLALAVLAAPAIIRRSGERTAALGGFLMTTAVLVLLGLVDDGLAGALDPVNVLRITSLFGVRLSPLLRTAGLLAIPLGFGLSLTTLAVQTYLNRRVPIAYQGRAFALQSVLKNGAAIVPLLTLGGAASVFGVQPVLIASPFVLLAIAVTLVQVSFRLSGRAPARRLEVLSSYWEESYEPLGGDDAPSAVADGEAEGADDAEHQRA